MTHAPHDFSLVRVCRPGADEEPTRAKEWLVTNGLGGYASGTILDVPTRRYHGLLVAALHAPLGRTLMLNHLVEEVRLPDGQRVPLAGEKHEHLESFSLELGLPVWKFSCGDYTVEKRVFMPHGSNTTHLSYRLLRGGGGSGSADSGSANGGTGTSAVRLRLRPGLHFRGHEAPVGAVHVDGYQVGANGDRVEISSALGTLKLYLRGAPGSLVLDPAQQALEYQLERERGYPFLDSLWSPGYFRVDLAPGQQVTLSASTESWEALQSVEPAAALELECHRRRRLLAQAQLPPDERLAAELVLAADQFIITPSTRVGDEVRARAEGDELRSVIAGYHWFTDWGRDTMISLEGLTLSTGRTAEAGYILRTFGHYVRDGLIPNLFPEGQNAGLYHTADATLWFFHALDRYLTVSGDQFTLRLLLPTLRDIVAHHLRGTHFGIGVDPQDGLLRQGAEGYQLTWMDAKVGDWVVTPRRGKAVEINALWYNALRLLARWLDVEGDGGAAEITAIADRAYQSFNRRFWCEERNWLYDVIDGPDGTDGRDASLRPNQLLAISLPHAVLARERWPAVLEAVRTHLLTPLGLRTLAPFEPDYKAQYFGDLHARDAAYHQGTVWAWLIGPYVDAHLAMGGDRAELRAALETAFDRHLNQACIGTISEIFDAESPYTPRGCIAQAWSVAEVLRCYRKLAGK